ncbi:MAG: cysteine peptidase family C39 domain-containing protein [Eubacteriales bacterium]|nr:cysteine peptidase family C39 domain-containing protein [Eubacteriales bacterium]
MIYQSSEEDCSNACIRNILVLLSKDLNYATYPLNEKKETFSKIRETLLSEGASYRGFEIASLDEVKKEMLPGIAQITREGRSHFVVVKKIGKKKVSLLDPEFGRLTLSREDFLSLFTGKMLLKQSYTKKKCEEMRPGKRRYPVFSLLLFLFQSLALEGILFFAPQERGFPYGVVAIATFAFLILLQNALNFQKRKEYDKNLLLPYMEKKGKEEDYPKLSKVISLAIEIESSLVTYGVLLVGLLTLLLKEASAVSFLALLSLIFSLLRISFTLEQGKKEEICVRNENLFLKERKKDPEKAEEHYAIALENAYDSLYTFLFTWILQALVELIFISALLFMEETFEVDKFLYLFGLSLSFSFAIERLAGLEKKQEEKICLINGLSYPLGFFLLKTQVNLDYTKGASPQGGEPDERTSYSGLSRSDSPEPKA